jgi:hypothetical protein
MADNPYSYFSNKEQIDAFSDVDNFLRKQGAGALGGEGVDTFLNPEVKPDANGISVITKCEGLDCPIKIDVAWPELIFIMNGAPPPNWYYFNGHFRPHVGCPRCGKEIVIGLTPEECQKYVQSGVQAARVPAQAVQQISQAAQQARAQAQGQPGMVRR